MSSNTSPQADGRNLATRPWLRLYAEDMPPELSLELHSPLECFERCVALRPHAHALWYFDSPMSYQEIDAQAARLAAHWAPTIAVGDRIVILNQNTPATLVAIIAAWRLGAIVMPLSPMLTRWELLHHLRDGEPRAALVGALQAGAFRDALLDWGASVSVVSLQLADHLQPTDRPEFLKVLAAPQELSSEWQAFSSLQKQAPAPKVDLQSSDIAFLTYTSGTTGKPKAAKNTHGNVAFSAEVYRRWLRLDAEDVLFAAAPFSHVTGLVAHIATAWAAQVPVVMCYRFDPATVLSLLQRRRCTSMVAAITAYVALLDHPRFDPSKLHAFTKLFSGGAPVSAAIVDRWEKATGVYIHNAYGLTETTSPTHLVPLGARAPVDSLSGVLSVGVPVPATECRIVDSETLEEMPQGDEVGELLVRGPQVVGGYWRNQAETEVAFRNQWLRTGDLGRTDPAGWFYIVDRAKDVIVASGFKVWPREVELVLEAHHAIKEAAVVGIPDAYRGQAPKAFIVLEPDALLSEQEILAFCRDRLAPYKIPRSVEFVASLPRNHAGKLLRRALRVEDK